MRTRHSECLMLSQFRSLLLLLGLLTSALVGAFSTALGDETDRVVVIRNQSSPVSRAVADDYAKRRGVRNVINIATQDAAVDIASETIGFAAYQRDIERPVRTFLAAHPAVDFVVLTKGIPIRLAGKTANFALSVDGDLAALDYDRLSDAIRVDISAPNSCLGSDAIGQHVQVWANKFWNSSVRFSHARFGGYLITRLDGYTEADAEALTTGSLKAEKVVRADTKPGGKILLNVSPSFGFTDKARQPYTFLPAKRPVGQAVKITCNRDHIGDANSDMQVAADILKARGVRVELATGRFVGDRTGLMGYFSFGSNDPRFDSAAYHSLNFAPGAIAETGVSTSARTFLRTTGGQSLIADLIAQGVSGVKGYTDEPLTQAVASPSIMFDRYTRGWTLAESLYAASALVGWRDIVIGDPLGVAYSSLPK